MSNVSLFLLGAGAWVSLPRLAVVRAVADQGRTRAVNIRTRAEGRRTHPEVTGMRTRFDRKRAEKSRALPDDNRVHAELKNLFSGAFRA